MRKFIKAACAQVSSGSSDQESMEKLINLVAEYDDCDLIVFPEFYFRDLQPPIIERIAKTMEKTRNAVVFGAIEKEGDKTYDSSYFIEYERIFRYRKTHVHWTESFDPGDRLDVFNTSLGKLGMLVCYDSTFIETSRVLALKEAEIIVIVAAVPAEFDVKISLNRIEANASENQVFILYVNKPIKEMCTGNSMMVNPKGRLISCAGSVETVITGILNYSDLKEWREQERIFPFRRPELYQLIAENHNQDGNA